MIPWSDIKAAIKALVVNVSKLDAAQVRWRDEAEGDSWTMAPTVFLAVRDITQTGIEEERREAASPLKTANVNVCAQKTFVLGVRVEGFTQDVSDPRHAGALLETIKIRMRRSSSIEQLNGLLGLSSLTGSTKVDYTDADGRRICAYTADFFYLVADNDTDDRESSGDVIDEVIADGTLNTVDPANPTGNKQLPIHLDVSDS